MTKSATRSKERIFNDQNNDQNGDKKTMTVSGLRHDHGFTLIEILVAMSIPTIALLGLISVTVMVMKGNCISKTVTTATTLAKDCQVAGT